MLKKNNVSSQSFDTLIGNNASFEGSLKTSGLLRIDGKFTGDIIIDGDVIVGKGGKVTGNITTNHIEISGVVEGNVIASGQLKICSSGKLHGDIEVGSFIVEEKGIFDGKCKMKNEITPTGKKSSNNNNK